MNILTIIIIAILIVNMYIGYKQGLIKTVFSVFSLIVALSITIAVSPKVGEALEKNDKLISAVSSKVEKTLNLNKVSGSKEEKLNFIDGLPVPNALKETIKRNAEDKILASESKFVTYISKSIACMIINSVSFIVILVVILILLAVLCRVLNLICKLPGLNQVNKLSGLFVGVIRGLGIVWIFFVFLLMFSSTEWAKTCYSMIEENSFLAYLYNHNLIVDMVSNLSKELLG